MSYLHWKRLNFIQKGQNESRYHLADIKKAYIHEKISIFHGGHEYHDSTHRSSRLLIMSRCHHLGQSWS